ncbi:hypothetical protein [Motiliproteus sp.]|uniref:hypothetical protein n=1 Tax=Motiliproteus sp. TaxID=1898955 RepID=UPI003BAAA056
METTADQAETSDQIEQLKKLLLDDIHSMVNFALESGIPIPKELRNEISLLLESCPASHQEGSHEPPQ